MREDIENKDESSLKENPYSNLESQSQNIIKESPSNDIKQLKSLEEMIKYDPQEKMLKYKVNSVFNEKTALLNEKEGLKLILKVIQDDLDLDEETLEEAYEPYINNEDMTKREIKEDTGRCSLVFMFYIVSPVFSIINLVAIFESLLMMKILLQVIQNALLAVYYSWTENAEKIPNFSVYDFNNKYNYYYMFFDDARKDSFDFNLMFFTAFLGDLLLQSRGFRVSTFIFALINISAIFLIISFSFTDYDFNNNTYSFFRMLYLILSYILLLIGAGASALLSQQIIIDSNSKYNDHAQKLNQRIEELRGLEKKRKKRGKNSKN